MDQTAVLRGFVPVAKKPGQEVLVPGLDAALWSSPAEAMDWGQDMCRQSGHMIELETQYRHREYRNGVLMREF